MKVRTTIPNQSEKMVQKQPRPDSSSNFVFNVSKPVSNVSKSISNAPKFHF